MFPVAKKLGWYHNFVNIYIYRIRSAHLLILRVSNDYRKLQPVVMEVGKGIVLQYSITKDIGEICFTILCLPILFICVHFHYFHF